ncbi:MAG: hypothetical protein AB7F98_03195 [Novosphingobium sp.]
MRHQICALLLLAGTFASPAPAFSQAAAGQLPPGISQSSAGPFKVIEVATTDPARFQAAWKERKEDVTLPVNGTVRRNQPINVYLIFAGCKPAANGNCNVVTDFEFFDPAGGVYSKHPAIPQWQGPPAPDGQIVMGATGVGLTVEPGEKLGVYRIRTFTTDKVANVTVANEISVTVEEAQ